ncbi:hypothetical protein BB558_003014 [Smittium angustum]|uniref:Uncharacterized protein n=1 Tax=Smittium angustum TaxID=133377 RepID=A0A2U1J763_SMIAN|nr:hypothetical protein BB558_003014 [Smittium angustum]
MKQFPLTVMCNGGNNFMIGCHMSNDNEEVGQLMERVVENLGDYMISFEYDSKKKNLLLSFPTVEDTKEFLNKNIMVKENKVEFYKTVDTKSNFLNISIPSGNGIQMMEMLTEIQNSLGKIGTIHDIAAWKFNSKNNFSTNHINTLFTPSVPVKGIHTEIFCGKKKSTLNIFNLFSKPIDINFIKNIDEITTSENEVTKTVQKKTDSDVNMGEAPGLSGNKSHNVNINEMPDVSMNKSILINNNINAQNTSINEPNTPDKGIITTEMVTQVMGPKPSQVSSIRKKGEE